MIGTMMAVGAGHKSHQKEDILSTICMKFYEGAKNLKRV